MSTYNQVAAELGARGGVKLHDLVATDMELELSLSTNRFQTM